MMRSLQSLIYVTTALFLIFAASVSLAQNNAQDRLVSTVDRTKIGIDESLELQVRYYGPSKRGQPDFTQLNTHFEIISTRQSNQFSAINGQVTSYTDWVLILTPKKEGALFIPSFRFGSLISDAIQINVLPQKIIPNKVKDIFIETVIEQDSAYVQEQVVVKYRLFYSRNVNSLNNEPLEIPSAVIETLPDTRYNRRIDGKLFAIAEFGYAIYPQESGDITIPKLVWDVTIPKSVRSNSFFGMTGRTETLRLRTDEKTIQVLPRPDSYPATDAWIPAQNLTLEETWSRDPSTLKVGEPVTRTITLRTDGLMAAQLPPIWQNGSTKQIKVYADQADLKDEPDSDGFHAQRTESFAIVLNESGTASLPPVKVAWWNTKTNALEYAALPEVLLSAAGQGLTNQNQVPPIATQNPSTSEQQSQSTSEAAQELTSATQSRLLELENRLERAEGKIHFWQWLSAILAIVTIALGLWIYTSPSREKRVQEKNGQAKSHDKAFSYLLKQCQTAEPIQIRNALLAWARLFWPNKTINSLDDLVQQLDDTALIGQIREMDKALFSTPQSNDFDALQLASMLKISPSIRQQKNNTKEDALAPLYGS